MPGGGFHVMRVKRTAEGCIYQLRTSRNIKLVKISPTISVGTASGMVIFSDEDDKTRLQNRL